MKRSLFISTFLVGLTIIPLTALDNKKGITQAKETKIVTLKEINREVTNRKNVFAVNVQKIIEYMVDFDKDNIFLYNDTYIYSKGEQKKYEKAKNDLKRDIYTFLSNISNNKDRLIVLNTKIIKNKLLNYWTYLNDINKMMKTNVNVNIGNIKTNIKNLEIEIKELVKDTINYVKNNNQVEIENSKNLDSDLAFNNARILKVNLSRYKFNIIKIKSDIVNSHSYKQDDLIQKNKKINKLLQGKYVLEKCASTISQINQMNEELDKLLQDYKEVKEKEEKNFLEKNINLTINIILEYIYNTNKDIETYLKKK